jgi:hypothetical protein
MRMKTVLAPVVGLILSSAALPASDLGVMSLNRNGDLVWTNALVDSNISYRVEFASSPDGPWRASWDHLALIQATNAQLSVQVPLFYRVAINTLAAGFLEDTNFLAIVAHTNTERILIGRDLSKLVYTGTNGNSCVVYLGTNGLPAQAVDAGNIFLFGHYTSNTVDVALIPGTGAMSLVRSIAIPRPPLKPPGLKASLIEKRSRWTSSTDLKNDGAGDATLREVVGWSLGEVSIAACAMAGVASARTVAGSLATTGACGGALLRSVPFITGDGVIAFSSTVVGAFLCSTAFRPHEAGAECLLTAIGIANEACLAAESTLASHSSDLDEAEMLLKLDPASAEVVGTWRLDYVWLTDMAGQTFMHFLPDLTMSEDDISGWIGDWRLTGTSIGWVWSTYGTVYAGTILSSTNMAGTMISGASGWAGTWNATKISDNPWSASPSRSPVRMTIDTGDRAKTAPSTGTTGAAPGL